MSASAEGPLPSLAPEPTSPAGLGAEMARRVNRGTLILVLSTVCFFALNFVGRLATARALSLTQWGLFNLGVSFTALLSTLILLGLNNAVARSLAHEKDPAEQRAIVRWSLWVSAAISAVASVLTFLFASPIAGLFHDPALVGVLELLAISVGMGAITPVFAAVFQGFHDVLPNALFNQVVNPAVFVVFVLGLLYLGWGLNAALVAYVIADVAGLIGCIWYFAGRIHRHLPPDILPVGRPKAGLWSLSIALWGLSSLAFVTAYADTLILGAYWSAADVGYYSTAMSLARTLLLGGITLTFVFLPVAARLSKEGAYTALRTAYTIAARWILVLSIPLFLLFLLLPSQSVVALFTYRYAAAAVPLQFLALTAFASSIIGPSNACLAGIGRNRAQLASATLSAATNLALSFALIPTYGVLGAAVAWGIARALYPASNLLILYRDYGVHPFRPILLRPLVVTLAIAVPIFLAVPYFTAANWVVFPLFFVGTGIFIAVLIATRSLVPDDLIFVSALEKVSRRRLPGLRAFVARRYSEV
ncbi:MAG: oligosaccharide flippase family protein [Thermoplasmata archaeon]|nr:oligosaccharide flippase family protein [Thermoplasmata archaeon]